MLSLFSGLQTTLEAETRSIPSLLYGSHQLIAQVMWSAREERNSSGGDSVSTVVEMEQVEADEELVLERRPPDVWWRSSDEIGGHPFKHRRKKDFEKVIVFIIFCTIAFSYFSI